MVPIKADNCQQASKQASKQRQSGIELLRIFAAMGVVILHYNNGMMGGALKYAAFGSANSILLYILEAFCVAAVNIFVLINGYFDLRSNCRDLIKPIKLIVQVMLFNLAYYLLRVAIGYTDFSISHIIGSMIPANWFIILYCALYLVSPFLNVTLNQITMKEYHVLLGIAVGIFSFYPMVVDNFEIWTGKVWMGLSSIGMYGSEYGYTIINFILMYIIGAYLQRFGWRITKPYLIIIFTLNTMLLAAWGLTDSYLGHKEIVAWEYCSTFVVFEAVIIFLLFLELRFQNSIVNKLAKASLCVYLVHIYFLPHLRIKEIILMNSPGITLVHLALCVLGIYAFAYVVNLIYSVVTRPFYERIEEIWPHHSYSLGNRKS